MLAAPQVGFVDIDDEDMGGRSGSGNKGSSCEKDFATDYYAVINGKIAANSNVRYTGTKGQQDVIITQGVYVFKEGDVLEIFGSGSCSQSEAIKEKMEPLVPSIILSVYQI